MRLQTSIAPRTAVPAVGRGTANDGTPLPPASAAEGQQQRQQRPQGQEQRARATARKQRREAAAPCLPSVGSSTDLEQLQAQQAQQEGHAVRPAARKRRREESSSPSIAAPSLAATRARRACRPAPWQPLRQRGTAVQAAAMGDFAAGMPPAGSIPATAAAALGGQKQAGALARGVAHLLQASALAMLQTIM